MRVLATFTQCDHNMWRYCNDQEVFCGQREFVLDKDHRWRVSADQKQSRTARAVRP
jgi:hypothetical protein